MEGKKYTRQHLLPKDISESLGKLPPSAPEMEESVLGALMLEKGAMLEVGDFLKPEHFYSDVHREVYQAMIDLFRNSDPIDMRTVVNQLRKTGKLELVGGPSSIAELTAKVSSASNIVYHARVVQEMAIKRRVIEIASSIHQDAYDETVDTFDLLEAVDKKMQELTDGNLKNIDEKLVKEFAYKSIAELQSRSAGHATGIPSGFKSIDQITHGWQNGNLYIVAARPGMGKALGLDEKLLTPDGWIRMGEVEVGDKIAGSDGQFHNVIGVYPQGERQTYRVIFDDGTEVICDGDHLWETTTRADRKAGRNSPGIRTTLQIMASLKVGDRKNHSIKYHDPISFPERRLYVHPYVYGVLVGDGGTTGSTVKLFNPEPDVLERVKSWLPKEFELANPSEDGLTHTIRMPVYIREGGFGNLIPDLVGKRSFEKTIPEEYLQNSTENRLWLLRGLLDTDGHVVSGNPTWIEYSTSSQELAAQVIDLVRGLGGRATWRQRMGNVNGKRTRKNYRVWIAFSNGIVPVSSKKHAIRFKQKQFGKKFIKDVVKHNVQHVQCITVDSPDHLYVTTGNTLTHNTAFVAQICENAAADGNPCALFSLEMPGIQVSDRAIISKAEVDPDKYRTGKLEEYEWTRVSHAAGTLGGLPWYIDDSVKSPLEIRVAARRLKSKYNIKLLVLDFIQMVNIQVEKGGNRDQAIGQVTRMLKAIAKELNIPVIAISSLNRGVETRGGDKRPKLSDLRESGSIESDADCVIFLYRPEYYHITVDEEGMPTHGVCEFIFEKHRNGSTGTVKLKFIGRFTKFREWGEDQSLPPRENPFSGMMKPDVNRQLHQRYLEKDPTGDYKKDENEPF